MAVVHNKLVRDRIPEKIASSGRKYCARILNNQEYTKELRKKAFEELQEYMDATNDRDALEELADLLEIINALAETHQASFKDVEEIHKLKAAERGGFQEKVFLIDVGE